MKRLLRKHGVLNTMQICRLLNKWEKDQFRRCHHTFQEKPKGSKMGCRGRYDQLCPQGYFSVLRGMHALEKGKKGIQSRKLRFRDKGGIGSDVFRFWYTDPKQLDKQILRQTLLPYVEGRRT